VTPPLDRLVLRVDQDLRGKLKGIAGQLFDETRLEYPMAAIVRGLIGLGLEEVGRHRVLAPLFIGMRIARGRKQDFRFSDE
jgi:hypothetical protein